LFLFRTCSAAAGRELSVIRYQMITKDPVQQGGFLLRQTHAHEKTKRKQKINQNVVDEKRI
jgi:hypothetical protein